MKNRNKFYDKNGLKADIKVIGDLINVEILTRHSEEVANEIEEIINKLVIRHHLEDSK